MAVKLVVNLTSANEKEELVAARASVTISSG